MASNLLLWLVLFSIWPVVTTSRTLCPRIFFQNINEETMPYKMIEGVYINKENDYYNNFPVYRRENDYDLGLYYHNDKKGDKFLKFGNDIGDGSLLQYGVTATLSSDASSWLSSGTLDRSDVFGGLVHHWQYYNRSDRNDYNVPITASFPMIKAVCVDDDFRECNSDRVYLNESINDKNGNILNHHTTDYFYRVEGLFRNLRPVYKHSAVSWYLQYVDGYWVVSESYRPSNSEENAIMRVKDSASRPEYITKTWLQWSFGWRDMPGLRVMCRGVTSMSNICELDPCDSKATCVNTTDRETLCLCTSGFTGLRCSVNQQCPPSNKFTYLQRRPGDLGLSFCSGTYPSTRFLLCVDGNNSSYWSGEASICEEEEIEDNGTMTPTTTQGSLADPQGQAMLKGNSINFDDKPFLVPLVISVAILTQLILLPFVLWRCASCKRKCKEAKDDHRGKDHSRVGKELRRVKRLLRIASAVGPQEVEQGVRENQSDGERKNLGFCRSRNLRFICRLVSMEMYFLFYLWLVYLVGCEVSHCTRYGEVFYMLRIFAIVMLCLSSAIVLLESFFCDELDYLRNIIEDETALGYLQRMRGVPPKISIVVECYHFETNRRGLPCKDERGNMTLNMNGRKKIVTFVDREVFSFDSWVDVSKREMLAESNSALTRVQIESSIQFGDQQTTDAYDWQVAEMIRRNRHRDVFTEHSSTKEVPGLKKRVSAFSNLNVKPFWIRPLFFWIATLLQMTWPYRWLFRAKTDKNHYVLKKMVYKNTTLPKEVDSPGNPSSVVESRGQGNTYPGNPVSAMIDPGTGNPPLNPYIGQEDQNKSMCMAYSAFNPNAGKLSAPCPEVSHPNVPMPSNVGELNEPAPDMRSAPCSPFSAFAESEFSPHAAEPVPSVPPPS